MRLSAPFISRHDFLCELRRIHLLLVVLLIASVTFVACSDDPTSTGSELEPEPQPEEIDVVVEGVVTVEDSEESVEGAEVLVFRDDQDDAVGQTSTGEAGAYEITFNVPDDDTPDELRLEINAEGFEGYSDAFPFSTEVSRDVQLQAVTTEAIATGRVSDADSGDGIENATVTGTRTETGEQLFQVTSDATGDYEADIEVAEEPGEVTITADAEDFGSAEETVAFEEEITVDFALQPSTMEAAASGMVTDAGTSDGIEGATVKGVRAVDGSTLFEATTATDGSYAASFEVADEPAEVTLTATAEAFESSEETVEFAEDITVDFALEASPISVTASGTVTDEETGDGIEGASVIALRSDTDFELFDVTTDANGVYEATFEVDAQDEPAEVTIKADANGFESSSDTVAFDEELSIDFALVAETTSVTVSGEVTREDTGDAIAEVGVTGTNPQTGNQLFETQTNTEGAYEASFEVRLLDEPSEIMLTFTNEDFEESEFTVDFEERIAVNVTLQPIEINVSISGVVTAEQEGTEVEGATVRVLTVEEEEELASGESGLSGEYALSFVVLAPDAPEQLLIQADDNRFSEVSQTVVFDVSVVQDISLPSIPISTIEELQKIGLDVDYPIDGWYVQINNIDAIETENWNNDRGFIPIGDDTIPFGGFYDGSGFEIYDLKIDRTGENGVGLFGHVDNEGKLININLISVRIKGSLDTGGLVGRSEGFIRNSQVTGSVGGSSRVGGLVGSATGPGCDSSTVGKIEFSKSSVEIEGRGSVGGLIGSTCGKIRDSSTSGTITAVAALSNVGGLVGRVLNGSVESSFANVNVYAPDGNRVGGLIGIVDGSISTSISTSYATGAVTGDSEVGGLIGTVNNSKSVSECFAAGNTVGHADVGGLIGVNAGDVEATFWDTEMTGQNNGIGRGILVGTTGLTTDQMQGDAAEDNMEGFDFQEIWRTVIGGYPALQWEEQ